jgi:hypothetical protein
VHGAWPVIEYL